AGGVGLADVVARALLLHVAGRAERGAHDVTTGVGRGDCDVHQRVEIEPGGHRSSRAARRSSSTVGVAAATSWRRAVGSVTARGRPGWAATRAAASVAGRTAAKE